MRSARIIVLLGCAGSLLGCSSSREAALDASANTNGAGPSVDGDAAGYMPVTSARVDAGRDAAIRSGSGGSLHVPMDSGGSVPGNDGGRSASADGGSGPAGADGGAQHAVPGSCGYGDSNLPAEPSFPPACTTLPATQHVAANGAPSETALDTMAIQAALDACGSGHAVKLVASGANNAFVTGPLSLPAGVTLWVDADTTLFGTRDPSVYGSASALIAVSGADSGIVGAGVIDGQGGEPMIGQSGSFWDANAGGSGNSPALIQVRGATNFTLYQITLHNSPKFHVKLGAAGFVVWGVTIKTPSKPTNTQGQALTYSNAHNTDGIDPGEAASNGYIVCSKISVGDDQIAIKGTNGVHNLTIAHNHFGAGHGMSIGSEFQGGVSDVNVYDLTIDDLNSGTSGGSSNGIRIKSDSSRGGLVNNVTYQDICTREVSNPIILTPAYSSATGNSIPQYTGITIRDFHAVKVSATPKVTLDGYSSSYLNSITLDNVIVDGISQSNVIASYTDVTLGPGNVNFIPAGTQVGVVNKISGTSTPKVCDGRWVTF